MSTIHRPTESVRFNELRLLISAALKTSRNQFDIDAAIKELYGEDASIFQDEKDSTGDGEGDKNDNNMLRPFFESMLDKIHDDVTDYMGNVLEEEQVEANLLRVEAIIAKVEVEQQMEQKMEEWDKQSSRQAVENAKRPTDVSNMIHSQTWAQLSLEKEALEREIQAVKNQMAVMEKEYTTMEAHHVTLKEQMQQTTEQLEQAADVGSSIGTS